MLYELSEFNLYTIEQELGKAFPTLPLVRLIGDVKDLGYVALEGSALAPSGTARPSSQ